MFQAPHPSSGDDPDAAGDREGIAKPHVSRDHHYVPRFLLAGFTPSGDKSDKLWSFDRERLRPEHRTPTAVAFETDYYTVEVPGHPPDLIESFFSKVESLAAPIIRSMIANRAMPIGEDFGNLMYFLGLMLGRLAPMREVLKEHIEDVLHLSVKIAASSPENYEAFVRGMPPDKMRPTYEMMKKWASEEKFVEVANPSAMHAQAIMFALDSGSVALLGQRKWSLLLAKDNGVQFICSDVPISFTATKEAARPFVRPGLIFAETDFLIPLSRTVALLGRFEGRSEVHEVDDQVVALVNTRTMSSARRYIYAPAPEFQILDSDLAIIPGSTTWLQGPPRLPKSNGPSK